MPQQNHRLLNYWIHNKKIHLVLLLYQPYSGGGHSSVWIDSRRRLAGSVAGDGVGRVVLGARLSRTSFHEADFGAGLENWNLDASPSSSLLATSISVVSSSSLFLHGRFFIIGWSISSRTSRQRRKRVSVSVGVPWHCADTQMQIGELMM